MKIAIIGDPHFGASYHFGYITDNNINSRLNDFKHTLKFAIDTAAKKGCSVMAITGDLFKSSRPGVVEQDAFWSQLERGYKKYGMHFYVAAGNHDMPSYCRKTVQSIVTMINERTYVHACDHICSVDFPQDDVSIVLIPFFNRVTEKANSNQEILDFIKTQLSALSPLEKTIAVWHGLSEGTYLAEYVGGEVDALTEPTIPLSLSSKFNLCVFGHVHRFTEIQRTCDSVVVNIGSMEVNDFTDSLQDKFMIIADTDKPGDDTPFLIEYVKLPVVKAETLTFEMRGSIMLEAKDRIKKEDVSGKIVRLLIKADDDTIMTFDSNEMREYIEGLGAYKYMGTSFLRPSVSDDIEFQEFEFHHGIDSVLSMIRDFLEKNKMVSIEDTISYAKGIITKVEGESE